MVTTSVTVDASRAFKKLNILDKLLQKRSLALSKQAASEAVRVSKAKAPSFSGKTRKAIRSRTVLLSTGIRTRIFSPNTSGRSNFNLPRWMHDTNGTRQGRRWIRSGDPRYMYSAADYLRKRRKSFIAKYYDTIKLK